MKKILASLVLILSLSLPSFANHIKVGNETNYYMKINCVSTSRAPYGDEKSTWDYAKGQVDKAKRGSVVHERLNKEASQKFLKVYNEKEPKSGFIIDHLDVYTFSSNETYAAFVKDNCTFYIVKVDKIKLYRMFSKAFPKGLEGRFKSKVYKYTKKENTNAS
jgi:hypothetical protein